MSEFLTINAETRVATNTKQFDIPDEIYNAIVVGIANMGEVETTYQGETKKVKKVSIAFALDYKFANMENAVVTQRYTMSLHEKSTLGKIFAKIGMPKDAKLGDLIGKQVRIEIVHNGDYANVGSILTAAKTKMDVPKVYLPSWWYAEGYEMGKAKEVLEGVRPKTETPKAEAKPTPMSKTVGKATANKASVDAEDDSELPFN